MQLSQTLFILLISSLSCQPNYKTSLFLTLHMLVTLTKYFSSISLPEHSLFLSHQVIKFHTCLCSIHCLQKYSFTHTNLLHSGPILYYSSADTPKPPILLCLSRVLCTTSLLICLYDIIYYPKHLKQSASSNCSSSNLTIGYTEYHITLLSPKNIFNFVLFHIPKLYNQPTKLFL